MINILLIQFMITTHKEFKVILVMLRTVKKRQISNAVMLSLIQAQNSILKDKINLKRQLKNKII